MRGGVLKVTDDQLRRVSRLSPEQWNESRDTIMEFFDIDTDGIRQKRLSIEIDRASRNQQQRVEAGRSGAAARWGIRGTANDSDRNGERYGEGINENVAEHITNGERSGSRNDAPLPSPSPLPLPILLPPHPPKSTRASRAPPCGLKILTDLGIDDQVAKDWLAVRKAKRAPLTETALKELQTEAGKAGISVAEAVSICAKRSWQGFKADWLTSRGGNGTVAEHNQRERAEFLSRQSIEGERIEK
jgi:hypothetical protein